MTSRARTFFEEQGRLDSETMKLISQKEWKGAMGQSGNAVFYSTDRCKR